MPRVTVILTDEEYSAAKHKAGLIPLSAWFRSLAVMEFPAVRGVGVATVTFADSYPTGGDEIAIGPASEPVRDNILPSESRRKVARTCPHGEPKGYRCTLCGGIVP